jgi:hypothetical protein
MLKWETFINTSSLACSTIECLQKDAQLYCDYFQWQTRLHKIQQGSASKGCTTSLRTKLKILTHNLIENEMLKGKPPRVQL